MSNKLKVTKKFDLKKKINTLKNVSVKVGFPAESEETRSTDNEGVSAVVKATVNNFGIGVPKRPFMNVAFAVNKNDYKKITKKAMSSIETLDMVKFSNLLGIKGAQDVQKTITNMRSPANSQATQKAKGSSNPLIDSGHMRQSVTHQVSVKK